MGPGVRSALMLTGLAAILGSCGGGTVYMGQHAAFAGCDEAPGPPPASLGLNSFYAKYLDGYGTPVLSSANVSDEALLRACRITGQMFSARPDVRTAVAANRLQMAVLGTGEHTTEIPEYADLYGAFPNIDWDHLRGLTATRVRPTASVGEENLLCLDADGYKGQSVLLWTLGYAIREVGIADVDAAFDDRLQSAYTSAMSVGLWTNTNAAANAYDYWAEGAQNWFGGNVKSPANSRDELLRYDPGLGLLLAEWLPAVSWKAGCSP